MRVEINQQAEDKGGGEVLMPLFAIARSLEVIENFLHLSVDVSGVGFFVSVEAPEEGENVGLEGVLDELVGVRKILRVLADVQAVKDDAGVGESAGDMLVAPPVLHKQPEHLPAEVEPAGDGNEVGQSVFGGVLVFENLLRPDDAAHSQLVPVGEDSLILQLQLVTQLSEDRSGPLQACFIVRKEFSHSDVALVGHRWELRRRHGAVIWDVLDQSSLDDKTHPVLRSLEALSVRQDLDPELSIYGLREIGWD